MTTGQRIAEKRRELNLSQEALGEELGVSRQSIYKWESDASLPDIDKLVALSRLFKVPVGWLLGVEDVPEAASGEFSEEQIKVIEEIFKRYQPKAPEKLTEGQRYQVSDLIDQRLAVQSWKKKPIWPWVVGILAVAVLILWAGMNLFDRLYWIERQYHDLSNSVSGIEITVNRQLDSVASRVEEILQAQNSLVAEWAITIDRMDPAEGTVTFAVRITPKTYVEGLEVVFLADMEDDPAEFPAWEDEAHRFYAEVTCPLTDDDITISAVLIDGSIRQTQLLDSYSGLYSNTLPAVSVEDYAGLWGVTRNENGSFHIDENTRAVMVSIYPNLYYYSSNSEIAQTTVTEVRVGLFRNRELLTWLEPSDEPFSGFDGNTAWAVGSSGEDLVFHLPNTDFSAEQGDEVCFAALVTDEYGRQQMALSLPTAVVKNGEIIFADEFYSDAEIFDPANWKF